MKRVHFCSSLANRDANVLNVLAEAKNGDICLYNRVYLEKAASLGVQMLQPAFLKSLLRITLTCQTTKCKENLCPSLILLQGGR